VPCEGITMPSTCTKRAQPLPVGLTMTPRGLPEEAAAWLLVEIMEQAHLACAMTHALPHPAQLEGRLNFRVAQMFLYSGHGQCT
jgi:hypothetical protein